MDTQFDPTANLAPPALEPPPAQFNFAAHVFALNRARGHKAAYIDDAGTTTYRELEDRARRFASALRALGVHPEERLLLVMHDTVELPVAFLGALYAGVVPVVVNTLLTSPDYVYMLTHSRARAVVASGALLATVADALEATGADGRVLIVSQPEADRVAAQGGPGDAAQGGLPGPSLAAAQTASPAATRAASQTAAQAVPAAAAQADALAAEQTASPAATRAASQAVLDTAAPAVPAAVATLPATLAATLPAESAAGSAAESAAAPAAPARSARPARRPNGAPRSSVPALAELIDGAEPARQPAETSGDDIAFWLYSSGSTGKPKGTVHTHANLYWTVETYAKPVLGIRESDVVFSAAKLFFAYGLGNGLTFPLSVGATAVLMAGRPTADAVFERLVRHRPTVFYGVPTLYASMMAAPVRPARAEVSLRVCTSAGEALPREIGERFGAHFGCEILDGIGSTEMLHIFLSNRPGDVHYGTTGKPVYGYEVELRDEAGQPVPDGEVGDLYIKGPSAAVMYWSNREKSRATFLGEWVKSGDKYRRLPNGCYVYAGRSDDMLKVSGQYVSPVEVEMVLVQHDAVLEAAVIGVDQGGLVKTCAFVVLKQPGAAGDALTAELKAFVKERLAPHKYPREIIFVDDLPKTATGKIQRFKLREQTRI